MDENQTIEELKKQLEDAKAENQRLEEAIKYKDKLTGLWNRKYAEKLLEGKEMDFNHPDFTVICADFDNLFEINSKRGVDAGDEVVKQIAQGIQNNFEENGICCKLAGTKIAVFLIAKPQELNEKLKSLNEFIDSIQDVNPEIEINYGFVRHAEHPDKDAAAMLKEAEYALMMNKVGKETEDSAPAVLPKKRAPGDLITILMIDDSLVILRTLQMMLKDSYRVLMTTSGMEGYEIAKAKNPDLILLDYKMPVVDGERIMQLLKKSNQTRHIPVIFVSGVSDKEKILKIATLKPAGYLLKPVEKENLLSVINSVLQQS